MKSSEAKVGGTYLAKVSGAVVPVRITGVFGYRSGQSSRDGWTAVNTRSGREVRIRSPQRLRGEA